MAAIVAAGAACGSPASRPGEGAATGTATGSDPGATPAAPASTTTATAAAPITPTTTPTSAGSTPTTASTATTEAPAPDRRPGAAVATTHRTFVDAARNRTLTTTIYYPSADPPSTRSLGTLPAEAPADAAPVAEAVPLVLMVHGYLLPGDGYERLMKTVASAGYVVAAPELPHTTAHGGDGRRSDLTNQPADLSFVADQVIAAGPAGGVPAIRDPRRIAVVGHSDGGLTATALGYGQQFRDLRVVAVVSLTGGVALFPGAFFTGTDLPALLAVHARDDSTNPYPASTNLFASVPVGRARFLLTIDSGGHIDPYMFATGRVEIGDAIAAFLDLTMANDPAAAPRLGHVATMPGLSLETGS